MLFADRSKRPDGQLEWKVRIFSLAAVLTLVGIYLEERWMTVTALILLVGGVLLRFVPTANAEAPADPDPNEDVEG